MEKFLFCALSWKTRRNYITYASNVQKNHPKWSLHSSLFLLLASKKRGGANYRGGAKYREFGIQNLPINEGYLKKKVPYNVYVLRWNLTKNQLENGF